MTTDIEDVLEPVEEGDTRAEFRRTCAAWSSGPLELVYDVDALGEEAQGFLDGFDLDRYDVYRWEGYSGIEDFDPTALEEAENMLLVEGVAAPISRIFKGAQDIHVQGDVHAEEMLNAARDVSIQGDVKTPGALLKNAADARVEGDVYALSSAGSGARDVCIEGDVWSSRVLKEANSSVIEGDVVGRSVLKGAQESLIRGDVRVEEGDFRNGNVLKNSRQSVIEGNVKTPDTVLWRGRESSVYGDVVAGETVLWEGRESSVYGDVVAEEAVLGEGKRSFVHGDVETEEHVLWSAERSHIYGDVRGESILQGATNSWVVGDRVEASARFGLAERSLLAARQIEGAVVSDGLQVITQEDDVDGLTYTGDWEELEEVLVDRLDGDLLEGLRFFELGTDEVETVDQIERRLDIVEEIGDEDVTAELDSYLRIYREGDKKIDLGEELDDGGGFDYREHIRRVAVDTVKERYGIKRENAERVLDSNETVYLIERFEEIRGSSPGNEFFSFDSFIEEFHGGSERYTLNPGFEAEIHITPQHGETLTEPLTDDEQEANRRLYEQGVRLLEQILEGRGQFRIDTDGYREALDEFETLDERIDLAFSEGDEQLGEELIEEKREVVQELERLGDRYKQQVFQQLGIADPDSLALDELREGLNQLWQEYLEPCPAQEEARRIAESITAEGERIGSNTVQVSVWEKDLQDLPTYEEYNCCIFPDGTNDDTLLDKMLEPDVQFLHVEAGEKTAMALTAVADNPETGEDYLLVNSVESGSNVLKREDVTAAVDEAITRYAEELGMDAVVYNSNPHNTAPQQFRDNLSYELKAVTIDEELGSSSYGGPVWLEMELGETQQYYRPVG